jgi:histidinol-phosphate aminotransferase
VNHETSINLSSNESSFGPSANAIAAFESHSKNIHRYPDGSQSELRGALSDVHSLDINKIVCGNGSEELIGLIVRSFISSGEEMLLSENHFVMCPIYGRFQGAEITLAPDQNHIIDVDALLERVSEKTRMVIIANPNNPTGTYASAVEINRLHAGLPEDVLLLIDEAYAEYVVADDFASALAMVDQHSNVIVTRTFSKIYGLAGLRIGWAYCPLYVLQAVQKMRTPFNANSAAMAAASAACRDTNHINMVRDHTLKWQKIIAERLKALGIISPMSVANFYFLDFSDVPDKSGAAAAYFLESRGILPRPAGADSSSPYLRITIGLDEENEAVLGALHDYMAS